MPSQVKDFQLSGHFDKNHPLIRMIIEELMVINADCVSPIIADANRVILGYHNGGRDGDERLNLSCQHHFVDVSVPPDRTKPVCVLYLNQSDSAGVFYHAERKGALGGKKSIHEKLTDIVDNALKEMCDNFNPKTP